MARKTISRAPAGRPKARSIAPRPKTGKAKPKTQKRGAAALPADSIDANLVRDIASILAESDVGEIEVSKGDLRIRVAREPRLPLASAVSPLPYALTAVAAQPAPAAPVPVAANQDAPSEPEPASLLKSPMVGTAYRRPSPEAKPFVEIGDRVNEGEKVLLVEAMKTFNEIVAHRSGTIVGVFVEDGQPVEYDQNLLAIE